MNPLCTVLVSSCDSYRDVEKPFVKLFRKYWPDCPFETVLVSETGSVEGFDRVVLSGTGKTWCETIDFALQQITTPYVILLMNDYFLCSPVNTPALLVRLEDAQKFNAASLRLNPMPPGRKLYAQSDLLEMPKNVAYCVTCQVSIWEHGFLSGLVKRNKSAWEFERQGSFMVADEKRPLLVTPTKEFPFLDAVHKGYWEKFGVKCLAENGIEFDFSKRSLPPLSVWLVERLKAFVFAVVPNTLIVRIQNFFDLGAKEKTLLSHSRELNIARS